MTSKGSERGCCLSYTLNGGSKVIIDQVDEFAGRHVGDRPHGEVAHHAGKRDLATRQVEAGEHFR